MSDWREIANYAGGELNKVVATYIWHPESPSGESYGVEIKIQIQELSNGHYQAVPNRAVKTPQQGTPYVSMQPEDTPEEALQDCISGFKHFMGSVEETEWPLFPDHS